MRTFADMIQARRQAAGCNLPAGGRLAPEAVVVPAAPDEVAETPSNPAPPLVAPTEAG